MRSTLYAFCLVMTLGLLSSCAHHKDAACCGDKTTKTCCAKHDESKCDHANGKCVQKECPLNAKQEAATTAPVEAKKVVKKTKTKSKT